MTKCNYCPVQIETGYSCESCKEKKRKRWNNLKNLVISKYGDSCACCGETIREFLSIDHVNNDGAEHRRTIKAKTVYQWLKNNNYPEGFQVLCMNCNFAKGLFGICPHKKT